jgi:tetratricopeptide (TPR) repeat protein
VERRTSLTASSSGAAILAERNVVVPTMQQSTLAKKIFMAIYWAVCLGIVLLLKAGGLFGSIAAWVQPWASDFDKAVYIIIAIVSFGALIGLQEQLWSGYLFLIDTMLGTAKFDVVKRDKIRAAKVLEKKQLWLEAARTYEEVEEMAQAAENYQKAKDWEKAARVLEHIEQLIPSAKMYEKAGSYEQAAALYERAKDEPGRKALHMRAGDRAQSEGRLRPAAEHFIQAGQYVRAGELLERLEHFSEAADVFLREGLTERAAELYMKQIALYEAAIASGSPPPGGLAKLEQTRKKASEALEKDERYRDAGALAEQIGEFNRAGMMYTKAGMHDKAYECFMRTGDAESAKQSIKQSGNVERLKELHALDALERGDFSGAGQQFLALNLMDKALDAFRRAKDYEGLGRIYEKLGRYVTAGEQYCMGRRFDKAAEMYEIGKDYGQAAELYQQIGDMEKAIACYEKRRDFYAAGELRQKSGSVKHAIACYQKVDRNDPNFVKACAALGVLFTEVNQFDEALGYFNRALQEGTPSTELLEGYYKMARKLEERERIYDAGNHYKRIMGLDFSFRDASDRYNMLKEKYPHLFESGGGPASLGGGQQQNYQQGPGNHLIDIGNNQTNPGLGPMPTPAQPQQQYQPVAAGSGWGAAAPAAGSQYAATQRLNPMPATTPAPGSAFGDGADARYELLEEIGRGGMGMVYKARDKTLDRVVALKMLNPSVLSENGASYDSFLREARAVAKLRHPNIVTIYDVGTRAGRPYISMEYVGRGSLRQYVLQNGPPSVAETMRIILQICHAIQHAHQKGIIHRDIKPANILLDQERNVKIVDFGLAKIMDDATVAGSDPHTMTGRFMMGTPHYMSPEQIRCEKLDARADIYSLGLTFYFVLVGKQVFDQFGCKSPMEIVDHQLRTDLPSPLRARVELPREIEIVYYGCIEKDRNKRFASMQDVMDQMSAIPVD